MNIAVLTINSEQSSINPSFDSNTNNDGNPNEYILQQNQTNNNSHEIDKHSKIPRIDSAILFQANNPLNNNEDAISSPLIKCVSSTQIPLISVDNDCDIINSNGSIENFSAIQKSSKLFLPPDIEISNYFSDLFQREIKVPYLMTKEKLLAFIDNYSIENYARKHFRKQQGIILFTNQGINELTTFSMKPLSKPLLEKTPISKKDLIKSFIKNYYTYEHDITKKQNI
ncbi:hypothetical protein M9Y10_031886 [Tritrichomonas musculus]|uniref:RGS domain-containing protein n=1 Tax=Tritrichomonas musculus TaxID=1915356 RepID=A0ABR2H016_9EUKA